MKADNSYSMTYRMMNFKRNALSMSIRGAGQFLMAALLQPCYLCVSLGNMSERHMSIFRNGVPTKWLNLPDSSCTRRWYEGNLSYWIFSPQRKQCFVYTCLVPYKTVKAGLSSCQFTGYWSLPDSCSCSLLFRFSCEEAIE